MQQAAANPIRDTHGGIAINTNPFTISYLSDALDTCDLHGTGDCICEHRCPFLNTVRVAYTGGRDEYGGANSDPPADVSRADTSDGNGDPPTERSRLNEPQ